MQRITVAADGSGDYASVQEAVDAVRVLPLEPVTIFVKNGVYREKIVVPDNKPDIALVGESAAGTVLSYGDYANMIHADGKPYGTFRTPTLTIAADRVTVENMTVENTAGWGPDIGQALALYVSGDRVAFRGVRLLGNQDTVYTSRGRQYFGECYIEGHVDFIFGSATAVFDRCEIHSLRAGYITAASTPEDEPHGYVFLDCRLTGSAPEATVFLGRPWRPHASTVFINTWMGPHIKPEGWDNWRNPDNERTARYGEFGSSGPGAAGERAAWARKLNAAEAAELTVRSVLAGPDGWAPDIQRAAAD